MWIWGTRRVDLNGANGTATRVYTTGATIGIYTTADVPAPWGADNTLEIASVTKPLTAIATLIMEGDGIVSRDSKIGDYLPCDWTAANSDVASINLKEIIQHQSGLPAQPPDRGPAEGGNPFFGYTQARLCAVRSSSSTDCRLVAGILTPTTHMEPSVVTFSRSPRMLQTHRTTSRTSSRT
jgi:CubicO group peptidase (beta-lactamase class C family)